MTQTRTSPRKRKQPEDVTAVSNGPSKLPKTGSHSTRKLRRTSAKSRPSLVIANVSRDTYEIPASPKKHRVRQLHGPRANLMHVFDGTSTLDNDPEPADGARQQSNTITRRGQELEHYEISILPPSPEKTQTSKKRGRPAKVLGSTSICRTQPEATKPPSTDTSPAQSRKEDNEALEGDGSQGVSDEHNEAVETVSFENQAQLYECEEVWIKVTKRAKEILQAEENMRSDDCREVRRSLRKLRAIIKWSSDEHSETIEDQLVDETRTLKRRLERFTCNPAHGLRERSNHVHDLYLHVIPRLVLLLKSFSVSRLSLQNPVHGLQELISVSRLLIKQCEKARGWRPRPSMLPNQTIRSTHRDIEIPIRGLMTKLKAALETALEPERLRLRDERRARAEAAEQERLRCEEELRQEKSRQYNEHFDAWWRKMQREKVERRTRIDARPIQPRSSIRVIPLLDTDDRDDDLISRDPVAGNRLGSNRSTIDKSTDKFPRPWREEEAEALVRGLLAVTGPDRFDGIMKVYGTVGKALQHRTMADVRSKASEILPLMQAMLEAQH